MPDDLAFLNEARTRRPRKASLPPELEAHRLLRKADVLRLAGLKPRHLDRLIIAGQFPLPRRIGDRAVAWKQADVVAWIESRPVATRGEGDAA